MSEKETAYAADAVKPDVPYTGCAECAFKHFTAAMALLDLYDISSPGLWAAESDVMLARAEILAAEAEHEYPEARVLVVGCLAAAETGATYGKAEAIRASRKDYMRGVGLEVHKWMVPYTAHLFAHILEGLREYPKGLSQTRGTALLASVLLGWREDSKVTAVSAYDVEQLRDALDREARRLADMYELFRKPEMPDETMRREVKAPSGLPAYLDKRLCELIDRDMAQYINAEIGGIVPDGTGVPLKSGPSSMCNNGGPTL